MYGTTSTVRRRRIIGAEFIAGTVGLVTVGAWLAGASVGLGGRVPGIWMIGAGLNDAPLAAYAIALSQPGALEAELAGVDTGRELRRYSVLQLWIVVPLSLIISAIHGALRQRALARPRPPGSAERSDLRGLMALPARRPSRADRRLGERSH
jgi:hypothetical protein